MTPSTKPKNRARSQYIGATSITKLNLADFQNAVPMLRELSIANDTDRALNALELNIESIPAFLKPKVWRVDAVGVGERYLRSRISGN